MEKNGILRSTVILTAAAIVSRLCSMYYRVVMSRHIGAEGMGLFELIFSVYVMVVTVAYSGVNLAVSRLAAERADSRTLLSRALRIAVPLGVGTGIILFLTADPISVSLLRDARAALALKIFAPSVPFMSVSICINSYFVGKNRVMKSATGQVLEQFIRLAIVLLAIEKYAALGPGYACAAVAFGMTMGEIISCSYAAVLFLLEKNKKRLNPPRGIIKKILKIAVPVAMGNYAAAGMNTSENILLPIQLRHFEGEKALATYGLMQGMVLPLMLFPSTLLTSLAATAMPAVAAAGARKDRGELVRLTSSVLRFTMLAAILIVGVFSVFPYQLGQAVYKSAEVGRMLSSLSLICPLLYLETVVSAMMTGLDLQVNVLAINLSESAIRLLIIIFLVPRFGFSAYVGAIVAGSVITTALKMRRLLRKTDMAIDAGEWIIKPFFAVLAAGVLARFISAGVLWENLPLGWAAAAGILIMSLIYIAFLLFTGAIKRA